MAELDASEPGWRLEDLEAARKNIPDEQNSALLVIKLSGKIGTFLSALDALSLPEQPAVRLTDEQAQGLRAALDMVATERAEAIRLKEIPAGRYPGHVGPAAGGFMRPQVQAGRELVYLLQHDAMLRAHDGDVDGALQMCQALANTARAIGDDPHPISQLVRGVEQYIAAAAIERALAQGVASDATLASTQQMLQETERDPLFLYAARGARAQAGLLYQALADRTMKPSDLTTAWPGAPDWSKRVYDFLPLSYAQNHAAHLRLTTKAIKLCELPIEKQIDSMALMQKTVDRQPVLARHVVWTISKMHQVHVRNLVWLRCAQMAVAAERYRLRHGQWPARTENLVEAGLLPALPTDPYDGQPLRWRLLADGAIAYSVSRNRVDDGGTLNRSDPRGPNTDMGFRLWNASARRQAP
jgi:hypothetical protein